MFTRWYLAQADVRDSGRSHLTRSVGSSIAHCPLTLLILLPFTVAATRPICSKTCVYGIARKVSARFCGTKPDQTGACGRLPLKNRGAGGGGHGRGPRCPVAAATTGPVAAITIGQVWKKAGDRTGLGRQRDRTVPGIMSLRLRLKTHRPPRTPPSRSSVAGRATVGRLTRVARPSGGGVGAVCWAWGWCVYRVDWRDLSHRCGRNQQ